MHPRRLRIYRESYSPTSWTPLYFSSLVAAVSQVMLPEHSAPTTATTSSIEPMSWSVVSRSRKVMVPLAIAAKGFGA